MVSQYMKDVKWLCDGAVLVYQLDSIGRELGLLDY